LTHIGVPSNHKQEAYRLHLPKIHARSWRVEDLYGQLGERMNRFLFVLGKTIESAVISAILVFCLAIFLWSRLERGPFWNPLVQWLRHLI
jgi:hypothetical protein